LIRCRLGGFIAAAKPGPVLCHVLFNTMRDRHHDLEIRQTDNEPAIGKSVGSEQQLARRFFPVRLQNSPPETSGKNFLLDANAGRGGVGAMAGDDGGWTSRAAFVINEIMHAPEPADNPAPQPPPGEAPARKMPFNEVSVLFPLLSLVTTAYLAMLTAEFFVSESLRVPAILMPVYIALLGAYAADKEIRRWVGNAEPPRQRSLFVYLQVSRGERDVLYPAFRGNE
jgi:hypothetical protein